MQRLPDKLLAKLRERHNAHVFRTLRRAEGLVDFCSNDYLGFSRSGLLHREAMQLASSDAGGLNGSGGSRLLRGHNTLFERTEAIVAAFHKAQAALIFNSGFDANLGFFESVPQRGDVVLYDALVHASIRDGIRMGRARAFKYPHNDLDALQQLIDRHVQADNLYVVTESVFSIDGDSPDLERLAAICLRAGCKLIVDEAHAIGLTATGLVCQLGLERQLFARIVTFGKALGCHGAAVLGSPELVDYLVNFARSFIYTTALPPVSVASIQASYKLLGSQEGARQIALLNANIQQFRTQVGQCEHPDRFRITSTAIQGFAIPGNQQLLALSDELERQELDVRPIRYPTVPKGTERLRIVLHSFNTSDQINDLIATLDSFRRS